MRGPVRPVAGEAGYALYFDGVDDAAHLGDAGAYLSEAAPCPMSVELWFKTAALTQQMDVTLLSAGPVALFWTKVQTPSRYVT
eukprot:6399079-Pyramimonas_sp.AAC.1